MYTGKTSKPTTSADYFKNILTHIQLADEARKVVVFEILREDLTCKCSLIVDQESGSILQGKKKQSKGRNHPSKLQLSRKSNKYLPLARTTGRDV